ncbi:hypothetical protein N4R57_00700 [Rhodobacteraceae bacterium D3-12]|nr:hypothetical protein N4R57_00700 [Rhodobacteraceae bacterium D3-12]
MGFSTHPILIHAGFHKTGTTTIQKTLRSNRAALRPHAILALRRDLEPLLHAARAYSAYGDPLSLAKFTMRAETFVAALPGLKKRGLILSSEELSGHLPGRGGIPDYRAAPVLMGELAAAFQRRYDTPDLTFVFTTRDSGSWLTSAYWEQVKSSNQSLSLAHYRAKFAAAANFDTVLDTIANTITPARLHHYALEETTTAQLGPATPLLQHLRLPDSTLAALTATKPANTRLPNDALETLLALNRAHAEDSDARIAAKRAFLEQFHAAKENDQPPPSSD